MTPAPEIWIVDDEPDPRAIFSRVLTEGGYRVSAFRDGSEVLDRFRTEAPALLLLDVSMPGLNGWDTLKEWRRRGGTQPVLMITASNDVDSRVRGLPRHRIHMVLLPWVP
jgi:DNA-binding response OmpR family regulator